MIVTIDLVPGMMPLCFISAAIGAASSLIGTGISAIFGARAARQKRRELAKQERENNAWYDQKYNEVGTERAEAQAALSAMRAAQEQRMQSARGASAVMGASAGSVAAEKNAANMAMAQTIGDINKNAEAYKQSVENTYLQKKNDISNQRIKAAQDQAAQMANAGSQMSQLGAGIAGGKAFG